MNSGTLLYIGCLALMAAASFQIVRLSEVLARRASPIYQEAIMLLPLVVAASLTASWYQPSSGYMTITRDMAFVLVVLFFAGATFATVVFGAKGPEATKKSLAATINRKGAFVILAAAIALSLIATNSIPEYQLGSWLMVTGLVGLAGLIFLILKPAAAALGYTELLFKAKRAPQEVGSLWLTITLIPVLLLVHAGLSWLLSTFAFEMNAALGISDSFYAVLLAATLVTPICIQGYSIARKHGAGFGASLLLTYFSRFLLGFLALTSLATAATSEIMFALSDMQQTIIVTALVAAYLSQPDSKGEVDMVAGGAGLAVTLLALYQLL